MPKQIIAASTAPAAVGPYSQAVRVGDLLFCAGQIPLTPAGELVGGDIAAQTRQVLTNLAAVVAAAGGSLAQVVKTTVYCVDLADFPTINAVYAEFFGDQPPARATVQVAALPRSAGVEIEAVVWLGA
ncbi:MAG: RidA family protein [Fimbriimonadaceae bacterium]|nr:RidA family protein [Fimbriimonadaceae bacterium]